MDMSLSTFKPTVEILSNFSTKSDKYVALLKPLVEQSKNHDDKEKLRYLLFVYQRGNLNIICPYKIVCKF